MAVLVHVDDIVITDPSLEVIDQVKAPLYAQFKMMDSGNIFVGLRLLDLFRV